MTEVLECRSANYSVGRARLVEDVSMVLQAGEVLAIAGANGAGKSTLLRLLSGDLKPTAGDVLMSGRRIPDFRPRELALKRSVLPQRSNIEFGFSVAEVVMMGCSPHVSRGVESDDEIVADCLGRAGVSHLAGRSFPSLSGGEQARVCFARVLAQQTPVMLLDEPTASLDIRFQHLVLGEAHRLAGQGTGVIAVLHDLNLAAAYATRILLMHRGAAVALGRPEEVLRPGLLSEVYGHPVDVSRDGPDGRPLVIPRAHAGIGSRGAAGVF